ncbi:Glycosyltransferase [Rhynchospora pubera]|uniref:Glycosyltransferase n=1 Tax=Rhynchospora pubera TaxID=906938 RepID=A0AAV8G266_9POAL|nr:Glycosyltransferase [Rhynchospora pubera]
MENGKSTTKLPHIAFLSSPGMGHLIPLAELAKRLVCHHGFSATFLTFTNFSSSTQSSFLSSLHPGISSISLPFIPLDDIPTNARVETILAIIVSRSAPHVRDALASLKQTTRLVAFVPDLFGSDLLPVAKELSIPHYIFFTTNCMTLLFFLHLPSLHKTTTCEYRDLTEPFLLPGCLPLPGKDFLDTVMDRKNDAYTWILRVMRGYYSAEGILVNSFEKMEPGASEALKNEKEKHPPVYLVGPYSRSGTDEVDEFHCLDWLDQQPKNSVLFVSFGSGGTLSMEQTTELAFGLEASGQRFLWVVRCPSDKDKSAAFFDVQSLDNPLNYLPDGFVKRNADRGMVVPSWAPQVKVLAHAATGGFLSHCGWNSTLESVSQGVPMITWPLYAEQRMNALMLVDGAGIALRPVTREDGLVERGEVATVVKELMDGESGKVARRKVKELQEAGISALLPEGSSHLDLTKAVDQWMNTVKESI